MKIVIRILALLMLTVLQGKTSLAQNLIYDGDFNLSGAGWSTSCVNIECWGFETTYGGPSSTNHVAEIDDQACMHQDVCVLPGASYVYSMDASCRTAGGPNPCTSHITITGLDASGAIVATFVNMDYVRTNTVFALTPVTGIPVITIPPCSSIVRLRVELTDNTPGYSTLGMIVDNISLVPLVPVYILGPGTTCVNVPASFSIFSAAPCLDYSWSFSGGSPSVSTLPTPSATWGAAGTYAVTLSLGNGTCNVYSLSTSIDVKPKSYDTVYAATCAGKPYMFNGTALYAAGIYSDSFLTSGCDSLVTLYLTVTPKPAPPAISNPTYCQLDVAVPLSATGSSLTWYGPGTTAAYASAPTPSTTVPGIFIYYVTQSVSGCPSDSAKATVTVNPKPNPPLTKDWTYCQGSPASALSATGSGTLYWYSSPTGGTYSTTAPMPSTGSAGINTWYVSQLVNGCESDRAAANVNVIGLPSFNIGATHLDVCQNDTVSLYYNGGAAIEFTWTVPKDAHFEEGNGSSADIVLRFTQMGQIYISLQAFDPTGMCSAIDSIKINIVAQPTAQMYIRNDICLGDTVALSLVARSVGAYSYNWYIDDTTLFQSTSVAVISANANSGGPYELVWLDSGKHTITMNTTTQEGCRSVNFVDSVKVNTLPNASFTIEHQGSVCLEDSVFFRAAETGFGYEYQWAPYNYFNQMNQPTIWGRMMDVNANITLTVTDPYGCRASSTQPVAVEQCCTVLFPNAFTPDGDGHNDLYRPILTGYHTFHQFRIVNRWGQTVFQSSSNDFAWDGRFNGVPQDMDTYFYFLEYDCGGKTLTQKGDVTLVR